MRNVDKRLFVMCLISIFTFMHPVHACAVNGEQVEDNLNSQGDSATVNCAQKEDPSEEAINEEKAEEATDEATNGNNGEKVEEATNKEVTEENPKEEKEEEKTELTTEQLYESLKYPDLRQLFTRPNFILADTFEPVYKLSKRIHLNGRKLDHVVKHMNTVIDVEEKWYELINRNDLTADKRKIAILHSFDVLERSINVLKHEMNCYIAARKSIYATEDGTGWVSEKAHDEAYESLEEKTGAIVKRSEEIRKKYIETFNDILGESVSKKSKLSEDNTEVIKCFVV